MIRAVLFDLDGTLFDRDAAVRTLVEAQWRVFSRELAHVPPATYVERVLTLDAHGHGDKTAVYHQLAVEFGLPDGMAAALTANFWAAYSSHAKLFPEVLSALYALRARGMKLGLITNGAVAVQEPVIARLGLTPLMDVVLISEREGVRKPQPEIFGHALAALSVLPAEAWFVGDHPTVDVEAATSAGLTAVWRRNDSWAPPSGLYRTIDGIGDVLVLLEGLAAPAA
jgi:putative hydrolase of the HAD superfamily